MVIEPVRVPSAVGVNVTSMVQLAPAAMAPTQLSVSMKSPLAITLLMLSVEPPVLVGDRLTIGGGGVTPVPLSATECGLSASLSVMLRMPTILPVEMGAKLTLMVQLIPGARVPTQLLV